MSAEKMREEFEAWARNRNANLSRDRDGYAEWPEHVAWLSWKGALASAQQGEPVAWLMEPNHLSAPRLKRDVTFHKPIDRPDWTLTPLYAAPVAAPAPSPAAQVLSYRDGYEDGRKAGVPAGWKLVPVVPTDHMMDEGRAVLFWDGAEMVDAHDCYRAMLAAAPEAPEERKPLAAGLAADTAESLAVKFHEAYERLAPEFGYTTGAMTRRFDPESPNGRLMIAVCREMLSRAAQAQRKPLPADEVSAMWSRMPRHHSVVDFARAIEAAHGIKP